MNRTLKTLVALIVAIVLVMSSSSGKGIRVVEASSSELLVNGGFESYTSGVTGSGWTFQTDNNPNPANYLVESATNGVYEGSRAQRLKMHGATLDNQRLRIQQHLTTIPEAGTPIELSYFANIPEMYHSNLTVRFEFYKNDWSFISLAGQYLNEPNSGYTKYKTQVLVPPETKRIGVFILGTATDDGGYFDLYVDKVSVRNLAQTANVPVSLVSGAINLSNDALNFSSVTIDNNFSPTTAGEVSGNHNITVSDSRATGQGWSVNLGITDFVSSPIKDPTTTNGTMEVRIPATNAEISFSSPITTVSGQLVNAIHGPLSSNKVLSNNAQIIANASPGFGMGIYTIPAEYKVHIPKLVEIVSISDASSKYSILEQIGAIATTYSSTFTYTLASGI